MVGAIKLKLWHSEYHWTADGQWRARWPLAHHSFAISRNVVQMLDSGELDDVLFLQFFSYILLYEHVLRVKGYILASVLFLHSSTSLFLHPALFRPSINKHTIDTHQTILGHHFHYSALSHLIRRANTEHGSRHNPCDHQHTRKTQRRNENNKLPQSTPPPHSNHDKLRPTQVPRRRIKTITMAQQVINLHAPHLLTIQ